MKTYALLLSLLVVSAGCPAWAEGEGVPAPDPRREIDLRIEALDAERAEISTEGPQAATYLGLAMLVGGSVALALGLTGCGLNSNDCRPEVGAYVSGVVLLGVGGVTALTGGMIWQKRVNRRSEIDAERESLIEQRGGLAATLSRLRLSSEYRNDTRFVTLGARF